MLHKFLLWRSQRALNVFLNMQAKLEKLNSSIMKSLDSHEKAIKKIEDKKTQLNTTMEQHSKVIGNISKFLNE